MSRFSYVFIRTKKSNRLSYYAEKSKNPLQTDQNVGSLTSLQEAYKTT